MHTKPATSHRRDRRNFMFGVLLFTLVALAVSGYFGTSAGASSPTAGTIPPGGTIPTAPPPIPSSGLVNFVHVAPFATDLIDTGIEICTDDGSIVRGYIYYQQNTGYMSLPMGKYDWMIAAADSDCQDVLLDLPRFSVLDGTRLSLVFFGDDDMQPLDSLIIVEQVGSMDLYFPWAAK